MGGMQFVTFVHLMWTSSSIGYAIGLLVIFGPSQFDDGHLTAFTVIFFLIQLPYIVNLYFQAAWLCNDRLKTRRMLVIGYRIHLSVMAVSLFWQIAGAAITLRGVPSVYAYAMRFHPERFGWERSVEHPGEICNATGCIDEDAQATYYRQTDIVTNIVVYVWWFIWFTYWYTVSVDIYRS